MLHSVALCTLLPGAAVVAVVAAAVAGATEPRSLAEVGSGKTFHPGA